MNKKITFLFCLIIIVILCIPPLDAKAGKRKPKSNKYREQNSVAAQRVENLSSEDKRRFEALSDEQKNLIRSGKIDKGFNEWMVELALGKPYYATEHHPVFVDYEQVWLYTKPEIKDEVEEKKMIDPQTNWPTLYRKIKKTMCVIGDYFILWDRGIVEKIVPAKTRTVHGSCTVETSEAFLPIVNGKPVEIKE